MPTVNSLAIAPGSNILALYPILKYAREWSINVDDVDAETAFLKVVSIESLRGEVPFLVVHHTAKKTPWLEGDARMLTWAQTWLRYSLLRAYNSPCPEFRDHHVASLVLAGGWLRGRTELRGAGISQNERVQLLKIWKNWTRAATQSGFISSPLGVLTLHFMLKTIYLQHALYACSDDSLQKILTDIWPGELEQGIIKADTDDVTKINNILCAQPGTSVVLKNTFINFNARL